MLFVSGLHGKVLAAVGGATGPASEKSCWTLPPCLTEPMPAASKMDLQLAKAEPTRDCNSSSVITHLRRGKNNWAKVIAPGKERGVNM